MTKKKKKKSGILKKVLLFILILLLGFAGFIGYRTYANGGGMRLGLYPCKIAEGTKAKEVYNEEIIYERHRHSYEFNNEYRDKLIEGGLVISGLSPDEKLVEMIELKDHPWFVAVQYHPEFKSRPTKSHPLFREFIKATINN